MNMDTMMPQTNIRQLLCYVFSLTIILYIAIATIVSAIESRQKPQYAGRRPINLAVLLLIIASYIADASITANQHDIFGESQPRFVQTIVLTGAWSWLALRPSDPAHILVGVAIIIALFETPLLVLSFLGELESTLTIASHVVACVRILLVVTVVFIGLRSRYVAAQSIEGENVWQTNRSAALYLKANI